MLYSRLQGCTYKVLLNSVSVRRAWHCSLKRPPVRQCLPFLAISSAEPNFFRSLRSAALAVNMLWVDCGGLSSALLYLRLESYLCMKKSIAGETALRDSEDRNTFGRAISAVVPRSRCKRPGLKYFTFDSLRLHCDVFVIQDGMKFSHPQAKSIIWKPQR